MTLLFSILGMVLGLTGQPDTLKTWHSPAAKIASDPLGQYYMVRGSTLVKYSPSGDSISSWSEPQSGPITWIDAADPMRILVYQKDFNLLRFLNNRLAPIAGPIRLDDPGFTVTLGIATSRRGGFWIIDGTSMRLKQIDMQLNTVVESMPLNLPQGAGINGCQLTESGDQVLLLIPGAEIQVFDLFANYLKKIPVKVRALQAVGKGMVLVYPDRVTLWRDAVTEEVLVNSLGVEKVRRLGGEEVRSLGAEFREACLYQDKLLVSLPDRVVLLGLSKK